MSLARYDVNLLLVAVTALSAALAFVAALHLYARCYLRPRHTDNFFSDTMVEYPPDEFTWALHQVNGAGVVVGSDGGGGAATTGLDAKVLLALPVFRWESNKVGEGDTPAESVRCAVCLGHMADGDLGRLLPACRHVFHVHCIDKWFGRSSTCPICRTKVEVAADAPSSVETVQPRDVE